MKLENTLSVPVIDISALVTDRVNVNPKDFDHTVERIGKACGEWGFFYIVNHGIDKEFVGKASKLSTDFFLQPKEVKDAIRRTEVNSKTC